MTELGLSHSSFAVVAKGAKLDRTHGSTLRLSLNVAATVKLVFTRVRTGRRSKGSCRLQARTGPRCSIASNVGTITRSLASGKRTIAVSGVVGRTALAPGKYRLTVTARAGGRTVAGTVTFTIVTASGKGRS